MGTASNNDSSFPDRAGFPIVGVGASAGGVSASTDLLQHLGSAPSCALIFIHHLDPTHESSLVEILARATAMPVAAAADGLQVKRNHVYVMPPNAGLLITHGVLQLTARAAHGLDLPIDRFFEALAHDQAQRAIGVVLTGGGSDGTRGLELIKQAGGITITQDASAEYRSMPESAAARGCVDFVMSVGQIASTLRRLSEQASAPTATAQDEADPSTVQRIRVALHKATGIDFANYKQTTVQRRLQRRMALKGLTPLCAYAQLLENDAGELAALSEDILIHVTSFFRDPDVFAALKQTVFPKLLEQRSRDANIRIWVPGCSTGEEVYSIAICLQEFISEQDKQVSFKVFGTDVSAKVVERARAARYAAAIEQDLSQERMQRFFSKVDGTYQILQSIRDLCVFAKQNVTRDPPFSGIDLISCRNLLIYLGSELQQRLLPIFHYALKEPGFLLLGSSETAGAFPGFSVVDQRHKIYARSSSAPRILLDVENPSSPEPSPPAPLSALTGLLNVHREADRLVLAEFAPPGVVVSDDLAIVQFRGKTGSFLDPTPGVASFDLMRMVRDDLRLPVRQAINEARAASRATCAALLRASSAPARRIEIEVLRFNVVHTTQRFFLVLFKELELGSESEGQSLTAARSGETASAEQQLAQELAWTRDHLQSMVEQAEASNQELRAANEEIVSNNEELRSTNEELQMAKEELQATNEELRTVNDEMAGRNVDSQRLSDDLSNVLSSVEIPIIMLSRDLSLRRFTPAAARLLRLSAVDLGRSISDISLFIPASQLSQLIDEVLEHLSPISQLVQDSQGHWYQLTLRPYISLENRVDGVVLAFVDVDAARQREVQLSQARQYAERIVDAVPAAVLVLDEELRVRSANRAYRELFGEQGQIEGHDLRELSAGAWNIPELIEHLQQGADAQPFADLSIEKELPEVGFRSVVLRTQRVPSLPTVLLAFDDRTAIRRAELKAARTEIAFRDALAAAAEASVLSDVSGTILFANQSATAMFGYAADELLGMNVDKLVPHRVRAIHAKHRAEYLASPSPRPMGRDRNLSGRRKDGSEFPIEVNLNVIERESGQVAVTFISDITARREAEGKLHEYQEKLLRLSFDRAVAEEHERRRIAVGLHDQIGESLALAQIKLSSIRAAVGGEPRSAIDEAVALLEQSAVDTRSLIFELSPPVLYDLGLREALAWLAEDFETRHGLRIELHDDELPKPMDDVSAALVFRAVRELLMNVVKHAKTSLATVWLRRVEDDLEVSVGDAGLGFVPRELNAARPASGFGLFSVREQIGRLGGSVRIESAPGTATRVLLRVPLKRANLRNSARAREQDEP